MWVNRNHYHELRDKLVAKNVALEYASEQIADLKAELATAHARNQKMFDVLMQVKHEHPGIGYQDTLKRMFEDGETLMEEDPEELRKLHTRMQQLQDDGLDPGLVLLEELDVLRDESDVYGPGVSEES